MIVPRSEMPVVESEPGGLAAAVVGDDATRLAKLRWGDVALVIQACHVSPQVVVAIVDPWRRGRG